MLHVHSTQSCSPYSRGLPIVHFLCYGSMHLFLVMCLLTGQMHKFSLSSTSSTSTSTYPVACSYGYSLLLYVITHVIYINSVITELSNIFIYIFWPYYPYRYNCSRQNYSTSLLIKRNNTFYLLFPP